MINSIIFIIFCFLTFSFGYFLDLVFRAQRVYINIRYIIGIVGHLSCSTSPLCWAAPRSSPTWGWQSDPAQALQYSLSTLTGDSTSCQVPGNNNNSKLTGLATQTFSHCMVAAPSLWVSRGSYTNWYWRSIRVHLIITVTVYVESSLDCKIIRL